MIKTSWLPALIKKTDFDNDLPRYIEAIYDQFKKDFIESRPTYRGRRLGLKRLPMQNGKEATFWHMITEGDNESDRTIASERCERIAWPAPVISNSEYNEIRCWKNRRNYQNRILIWLVPDDYLVILTERPDYILPWTAYPLTYDHTRKKLEKEYQEFIKKQGALPCEEAPVTPSTPGR